MKKFLLAVVILFAVFWVGTLFLIPNPLAISAVSSTKAPSAKVNSVVLDTANWYKWLPKESVEEYHYSLLSKTTLSTKLLASCGSDTFTSELLIIPTTPDSVLMNCTTVQAASSNPFIRIQQYNRAKDIRRQLQILLDSLVSFIQDRKRMYGLDIAFTRFTNPFMINAETPFNHYPTVDEVYSLVNRLHSYAQAGGAVAIDSPMVNIDGVTKNYLLRVALPINKELKERDGIFFKKMVLGNTLLSTVTGGSQQVEELQQQVQNFVDDYQLNSPAIPFQIWQTNRQQQLDSSKWITRLYYPIY